MSKGWYERECLECLKNDLFNRLHQKRVAVDIGANIGNHSVFFSNHFDLVLSFEPNPKTFQLLKVNSTLSNNIRVFPIGCSSAEGKQRGRVSSGNLGDASLHSSPGAIEVEFYLAALDQLIPDYQHEEIDFIKLDIEGHELEALRGAQKILENFPVVAFEQHGLGEYDFWHSEIVAFLQHKGYLNFYALTDQTPLAGVSRRGASLLNAVFTLVTGRRIVSQKYKLELMKSVLKKNFDGHLIIATK